MSGFVHGCHGKCRAKIKAPALAKTSCMSRTIAVNYSDPSNIDPKTVYSDNGDLSILPLNTFTFVTDIGLMVDEHESINLITGFSQTRGQYLARIQNPRLGIARMADQ